MLSSVDLRGFGQHRCAAVTDEFVRCDAERRIGSNAAVTIGATAILGQNQFADWLWRATQFIRGRQKFCHGGGGSLDGFPNASGRLNIEKGRPCLTWQRLVQFVVFDDELDL